MTEQKRTPPPPERDSSSTAAKEQHKQPTQPSEKSIDNTVEDTFLASDPPSHGGITKIK